MSTPTTPKRQVTAGRTALNRGLHLVVPVVLLWVIFYSVGSDEVVSRLGAIAPEWVVAAFVTAQVQIILSALRWQLTARSLGVNLSFGRAVSEYYLSGAINMTLPGGVLGDGVRAFRSREGNGLEPAAHAVLIERLAGQVALAVVFLLGLLLSGQPVLQAAAGALLALLVAGLVLWPWLRQRSLGQAVPDVIHRFFVSIRLTWSGRQTGTRQILLSLLIVAANLASFACVAAATGSFLSLREVLYAVPMILLAMLIPFSVAGWGYREGAAAAVFPLIGATAAAGVSASVVFGAVISLANLPGIIVFIKRRQVASDLTG